MSLSSYFWSKYTIFKNFCSNFSNLEHILDWCPTALNQKRFMWRHDSIVDYLTLQMKKVKPENLSIYSDIDGHMFNARTIPPDILCTSSRPDIVIIDRSRKIIELLELSCSFEKNFENKNNILSILVIWGSKVTYKTPARLVI